MDSDHGDNTDLVMGTWGWDAGKQLYCRHGELESEVTTQGKHLREIYTELE